LLASTPDSATCGGFFDLDARRERLKALEDRQADPGFWTDQERAREVVQELKLLRARVNPVDAFDKRLADAGVMQELIQESPDPDLEAELEKELEQMVSALGDLELQTMLQGPDDARDAILTGPSRGRRHRVAGLGPDADADVRALGRTERIRGNDPRPGSRRRSGHQVGLRSRSRASTPTVS
jgi:hypothetical protein